MNRMNETQKINYLSVCLWELLGYEAPTQYQIDVLEQALARTIPVTQVARVTKCRLMHQPKQHSNLSNRAGRSGIR